MIYFDLSNFDLSVCALQVLDTDDSKGISFAELCQEMRKLVRAAREQQCWAAPEIQFLTECRIEQGHFFMNSRRCILMKCCRCKL